MRVTSVGGEANEIIITQATYTRSKPYSFIGTEKLDSKLLKDVGNYFYRTALIKHPDAINIS